MMIPHHQSAIDMARAYLDSGEGDPTLTRISRDVISSQEKEVAELRAWIEAHKGQIATRLGGRIDGPPAHSPVLRERHILPGMEPTDSAPRISKPASCYRAHTDPAQVEVRGLAFFGIISASLFGFLTIASEMREGETHAFDDAILRALRSPTDPADTIGPFWVEAMMRDLTALGGYTVLSLILVLAVTYLLMKGSGPRPS